MDLQLTATEAGFIPRNGLISEHQLTHLNWELTATETISGVFYTANPACGNIELGEPTSSGYIPYGSLTETELKNWTQSILESLAGPESYGSLWDYLVAERQADIVYQANWTPTPDVENPIATMASQQPGV
tara:strand:+ start:944 stop:1336 length:393 start_codon:yes stop_codon:yes gene_type:complete